MSRYYNTQRGPLPIPLPGGRSVSVPPKSWIEIAPEDEGSERVVLFTQKRFLVKETVPSVPSVPKETKAPETPSNTDNTSPVQEPAPEPKVSDVPVTDKAKKFKART